MYGISVTFRSFPGGDKMGIASYLLQAHGVHSYVKCMYSSFTVCSLCMCVIGFKSVKFDFVPSENLQT